MSDMYGGMNQQQQQQQPQQQQMQQNHQQTPPMTPQRHFQHLGMYPTSPLAQSLGGGSPHPPRPSSSQGSPPNYPPFSLSYNTTAPPFVSRVSLRDPSRLTFFHHFFLFFFSPSPFFSSLFSCRFSTLLLLAVLLHIIDLPLEVRLPLFTVGIPRTRIEWQKLIAMSDQVQGNKYSLPLPMALARRATAVWSTLAIFSSRFVIIDNCECIPTWLDLNSESRSRYIVWWSVHTFPSGMWEYVIHEYAFYV